MSRTKRKKNPLYSTNSELNWKETKDGKHWGKPPSAYKKVTKAQRKAREKQALRMMDDPDELIVPEFPRTDQWDWS